MSAEALTIRLSGDFPTDTAFYETLYPLIGAPDWAGRNLDALYDVLTGLTDGPISIEWSGLSAGSPLSARLAAVLKDAEADRTDLTVTLKDFRS